MRRKRNSPFSACVKFLASARAAILPGGVARPAGASARTWCCWCTTDSHHAWPVAPNIIDQDFAAEWPNEKWGADISYVWTREGWLYLAVVIDLFARRVVGWAVGDRLHRDLALAALRRALLTRRPLAGLIHHSDRGSQYCSIDYQAELQRHGILTSMSGKGNCYDNANGRDVLQDAEIRACLADRLPNPIRGRAGHCPLHRRLLQPYPAPFGTRLRQPRSVRKTGGKLNRCLSTKAEQVQLASPSMVTAEVTERQAHRQRDKALKRDCSLD